MSMDRLCPISVQLGSLAERVDVQNFRNQQTGDEEHRYTTLRHLLQRRKNVVRVVR